MACWISYPCFISPEISSLICSFYLFIHVLSKWRRQLLKSERKGIFLLPIPPALTHSGDLCHYNGSKGFMQGSLQWQIQRDYHLASVLFSTINLFYTYSVHCFGFFWSQLSVSVSLPGIVSRHSRFKCSAKNIYLLNIHPLNTHLS